MISFRVKQLIPCADMNNANIGWICTIPAFQPIRRMLNKYLNKNKFWRKIFFSCSGVFFLCNADVMTTALFGTSINPNGLFLLPASTFAKNLSLRIQHDGFQPVSKDCLHVYMCINSTSSDYGTPKRNGVSSSTLYNSPQILHQKALF